jgi:hypothetical protein
MLSRYPSFEGLAMTPRHSDVGTRRSRHMPVSPLSHLDANLELKEEPYRI